MHRLVVELIWEWVEMGVRLLRGLVKLFEEWMGQVEMREMRRRRRLKHASVLRVLLMFLIY